MKLIRSIVDNYIQKHRRITALLSGVMFSVPFVVPELFLLSIIGVAVFVVSIVENGEKLIAKRSFSQGYLFGVGFFIPLYHWFIALYPFNGFDFTPAQGIFIVVAACVGISLFHSLFYASAIKLLAVLRPSRALFPILLASVWVLAEWALSLGELGFSWGITAITQLWLLPQVQTASLFGSYFITIVVITVGAYLGLAVVFCNNTKRYLFTAAAILGVNLAVGTVIYFLPTENYTTAQAQILQANVSSADKWENEGKASTEAYFRLLDDGIKAVKSDIIVLPESAIPFNYSTDSYIRKHLQQISTDNDVIIMLGAIIDNDEDVFNSLVAIYPDSRESNIYHKRSLAPFGEYIPYRSFFENFVPFIKEMNLADNEYTRGRDANLISSYLGDLGGLICFDSIFPENARQSVKAGASLLVLATNDSWYRDTAGVRQHADFARLRAIENGRFVVRAANTGISMFIDSKGNVLSSLGALKEGRINNTVGFLSNKTLYTTCGDTALYFCLLFVGLRCIFNIVSYIKKQSER